MFTYWEGLWILESYCRKILMSKTACPRNMCFIRKYLLNVHHVHINCLISIWKVSLGNDKLTFTSLSCPLNSFFPSILYIFLEWVSVHKVSHYLSLPHRSALLASQVLPYISQGDAYKQLEWVLLESHSNLLDILLKDPSRNAGLIPQRCQRLSALIMNSTLPKSEDLLNLQEQVIVKTTGL